MPLTVSQYYRLCQPRDGAHKKAPWYYAVAQRNTKYNRSQAMSSVNHTPEDDKKQSISLTRQQYFSLLKTVYLGNWMANANKDGSPSEKRLQEFEDTENVILSYAKQFGYSKYVDDELANEGQYFPTRAFEEETDVELLIDEYTQDMFWDELIERLAERDFKKRYNRAQIRAMSMEERIQKRYEFIEKWAEEIDENGLDNIDRTSEQS